MRMPMTPEEKWLENIAKGFRRCYQSAGVSGGQFTVWHRGQKIELYFSQDSVHGSFKAYQGSSRVKGRNVLWEFFMGLPDIDLYDDFFSYSDHKTHVGGFVRPADGYEVEGWNVTISCGHVKIRFNLASGGFKLLNPKPFKVAMKLSSQHYREQCEKLSKKLQQSTRLYRQARMREIKKGL